MRSRSVRAALAATGFLALAFGPAFAQEALAPSPRAVIYPGDVIRDDMLTDLPQGGARDAGDYGACRELLDRAGALDPTGESDPVVQAERAKIAEWVQQRAPKGAP